MKHREQIQTDLGIGEDTYHNLIIDAMMEYLDTQLGWTPKGRAALARSKTFSHWWFTSWESRDALWLNTNRMRKVPSYLYFHRSAPPTVLPRVFTRNLSTATINNEVEA